METIKSKIMKVYKEISEDNSRNFADRKFLKEYLGGKIINYRRKSDKEIIMKIYKTKYKTGTEIVIDNEFYFLTIANGITIIYNQYGKAVSISFNDGYEWTGESFISEEAIIEENDFRIKYQNFVNESKTSKDLIKIFNDCKEMLLLLSNTTCICDTTEIYNNLNLIYNYLDHCLHYNINDYFDNILNNVKYMSNSLDNYNKNEQEVEKALTSLNEYYKWLINLEKVNKSSLDSNDSFFKIVNEMKEHINKLFKKMTISQKDWDLLDYYHDEIEKMLENNEKLTTNFSTKNRNTNVTIKYVDLNDDNLESDSNEIKKESNKLFKRTTVNEKADYLTFKTLRKFGVSDYEFDAKNISVKSAKQNLKQFNKTQKKYEKIISKDQNNEIDDVSYEIYNTIKSAKENLVNSGINNEKSSDEAFNNVLRNNYNRSIYLKRQEDLKKSASKISKVKDILGSISNENFDKIKENYQKVKRRLIGLGAGIGAGILAITSFGAGAYKNYQKDLKNSSIAYESDDISIYENENQKIDIERCYETNLVGFGAEVKETEVGTTKETETERETVKETETERETVKETEKVEIETEISTEKILDHFGLEKATVIPEANFNIENVEVVPNETVEVQYETEISTEAPKVEETSAKLNEILDEKDLLNTYKNELQNLEALLPQSNTELENVRNIGDVVSITTDANLQNDEYSLIKHSEGHQSVHKDTLPRVICSIIMSDGNSGFTAKTMEEAESLLEQGYYVAGYGVLNPYSKDTSNLEGFFESEDVVGLVRK